MVRPTKNNQVDWSVIYDDWRTGEFNNKELSRRHGVSATSIGRKIKEDGWTTTVGPGDKPTLSKLTETVTPDKPGKKPKPTKSQTPDQLRKRAKDLAQRLLAEVEDITTYESEIAEIIEKYEEDPIRQRAALKAISAAERIKMTKELTSIIDAVDGKRKVGGRPKSETSAAPQGKKEQRQEEAEKVAAGRFAPRVGPRLVSGG